MGIAGEGARLGTEVLIVPLWNWNTPNAAATAAASLVLIVPLWNWNASAADGVAILAGFNRTFMELK